MRLTDGGWTIAAGPADRSGPPDLMSRAIKHETHALEAKEIFQN